MDENEITILNARVTKSFKKRANIVAALEGLSLSEWLRRVVEQRVIETEAVFFGPSDSRVNQKSKEEITA